jgi:hypothetical protein
MIGGLGSTYMLNAGLEQSMRMTLNLSLSKKDDESLYSTSKRYIPGEDPRLTFN